MVDVRLLLVRVIAVCMLGFPAGCGDPGSAIGLDVLFDPGAPRSARDQAERVEVYLVDDCAGLSLGTRPDTSLAETASLRSGPAGPALGAIEPGEYGLYAIALAADCAVVAAGCDSVRIVAGDAAPIEVTMGAFAGAPCAADAECILETGECVGGAGGTGGSGGGAPDPCVDQEDEMRCAVADETGVCRAGSCCTGCWDGEMCRSGTQTQNCGRGGEMCMFVPGCDP